MVKGLVGSFSPSTAGFITPTHISPCAPAGSRNPGSVAALGDRCCSALEPGPGPDPGGPFLLVMTRERGNLPTEKWIPLVVGFSFPWLPERWRSVVLITESLFWPLGVTIWVCVQGNNRPNPYGSPTKFISPETLSVLFLPSSSIRGSAMGPPPKNSPRLLHSRPNRRSAPGPKDARRGKNSEKCGENDRNTRNRLRKTLEGHESGFLRRSLTPEPLFPHFFFFPTSKTPLAATIARSEK